MAAPAYATERLKAVDAAGWRGAVAVGRALSRAAGARRSAVARPLVLRPGGMGDLIAAQIALEELGEDPRQPLWLVEQRSLAWARWAGLPALAYDDGIAGVLRRVAGRFDVVVNSEQRFGLSQAVARTAVARGGRAVALATNLAAGDADLVVPYDARDEHETVAFRRLFAAAGLGVDAPLGGLDGPPAARERSVPVGGGRLVAIAGRQSAVRDLTLEQWRAHVEAFAPGDEPVRIAAAPVDAGFADALAGLLGPRASRFSGGFGALVDAIGRAEALLSVDGGPVHIASYLGTPTRALFTAGRDRKWAPLAAGSQIVRRDGLPDQPCTLFGQPDPACRCAGRCREIDPVADVRPSPARW